MIKGLTYAIVATTDVPGARRFFTEQLGLSTEDDQADIFSQFTTREGTLWGVARADAETRPGGVALYLEVDDADAAHSAWREKGVEMVTAPHDEPFGRTFAFKTPDGLTMHAYTPS